MVSIITPFGKAHEPFLLEAFASIRDQTYTGDIEWVLVPNGGASVPIDVMTSIKPRVCVYPFEGDMLPDGRYRIGELKRFACSKAEGDIIVEFDADDIMLPTCLEKVVQGIQEGAIFVYSNNADFEDGTWKSSGFSNYYGWHTRPFLYQGHELVENLSFPVSAQSMRFVFWAPDHVRSWDKTAYWEVGGHDASLEMGDDHELMCRFYCRYGGKGFRHFDEVLYLYRKHRDNSCVTHNYIVQEQTQKNYNKYSRDMATKWAVDNGYLLVDLGEHRSPWAGYIAVDKYAPADRVTNLDARWPFLDESVGVIRASHIVEHLQDSIHTMNEAYRVLAPGGWLFIDVPSTDGRGAFQDPTHKTFWNENSFLYYTNENWARWIRPMFKGKFQLSRCITWFPTQFEKDKDIPIVQADLICLKEPYESNWVGEKNI
jgi:glycosyltransferase involved in cell wall biosynthesis